MHHEETTPVPRLGRRRMSARRILTPTVIVAVCVALGIAGAGGTLAYLNASVAVPGATVSAGTLTLRINGAASVALGTWNPTPNAADAKAFMVSSTGDVPSQITSDINVTSTQALRNYVRLRVVQVANATACTSSLTGGTSGQITSFPAGALTSLDPNETQWLCAIVSLDSPVPIARAGESVAFSMTLTATQQVS